jgi:hypothetical protein
MKIRCIQGMIAFDKLMPWTTSRSNLAILITNIEKIMKIQKI